MELTSEDSLMARTLLTIATITGGLTLVEFDLYLSILLKFISVASFICYILINQSKISKGWHEFISRFKTK